MGFDVTLVPVAAGQIPAEGEVGSTSGTVLNDFLDSTEPGESREVTIGGKPLTSEQYHLLGNRLWQAVRYRRRKDPSFPVTVKRSKGRIYLTRKES